MKRVHFIGICGTAMATLAAMLKRRGFDVRGSDQNVYPPMSEFLAAEGIATDEGYDVSHVTGELDLVVVGNAISRGNVELEEVLNRKIRYCSLPEAIRDHFLWGARSIVIAGTHGKTTTTSLAGWLLTHAGLDPSVLIGGIAENFASSYRLGAGRDFVIEGDEYDSAFFDKAPKFLKYLPDVVVVGNMEFDHADIYADLESIRLAFRRLVNLIPRRGLLVLGADSPEAASLAEHARCRVETFGFGAGSTWQADDMAVTASGTSFQLRHGGTSLGRFTVPLLGAHNVRNALAACAVAADARVDPATIASGLKEFKGTRRRLELRGRAGGVTVYDDFAHHPTAVAETLDAIRLAHLDSRVWAVFEPRSASSCRRVFQKDFAAAFDRADEVIVSSVYRSTLPEAERLSPEQLVGDIAARGPHARYIEDVDRIVSTLAREAHDGDLVVVMSNGGFGGIHSKLLQSLEARSGKVRG